MKQDSRTPRPKTAWEASMTPKEPMTPLSNTPLGKLLAEATARDWSISYDKNINRPRVIGPKKENKRHDIVSLFPIMTDQKLAEANARLICLAINNLRPMVKALQKAAKMYDELALSPLESAAKYGPDHEPPKDEDWLAMRQRIATVLQAVGTEERVSGIPDPEETKED